MLDASREWQGQMENMVQEKFQMHMQNLRIPKKSTRKGAPVKLGRELSSIVQGLWEMARSSPYANKEAQTARHNDDHIQETISEHVEACGKSSTAPGQKQLEPGATPHVQQQEVGTAMRGNHTEQRTTNWET